MQYITEEQIDKIASDTCAALSREPKVCITIHAVNGRPYWEGGINGHFFRIKTETPVEVPKSLASLIAQSGRARVESEKRVRAFRATGGKKVL